MFYLFFRALYSMVVVILYVYSRTQNSKYGLPTNVHIMSKRKLNIAVTKPRWVTKQIATLLMLAERDFSKAINVSTD